MDLTSNQQVFLATIIIICIVHIVSKAMSQAERAAERKHFKDMVDRGVKIEDIISPDNSDKGDIDSEEKDI